MNEKAKTLLTVAIAILGTGAILNLAGQGTFGATAQRMAKYVTTGYGV